MGTFDEILRPYKPSKGEMGRCPRCGYKQVCEHIGCAHLRRPRNLRPYRWTDDGECIACTNCGFTAHADFWEIWDIECAYLDPKSAFNSHQ